MLSTAAVAAAASIKLFVVNDDDGRSSSRSSSSTGLDIVQPFIHVIIMVAQLVKSKIGALSVSK